MKSVHDLTQLIASIRREKIYYKVQVKQKLGQVQSKPAIVVCNYTHLIVQLVISIYSTHTKTKHLI